MMGYLERPTVDDLEQTAGYVTRIWAEQEDGRDSIRFMMDVYGDLPGGPVSWATAHQESFMIYLDVSTTVALAQLQLLRDSMAHGWLVRIHYSPDEIDFEPYLLGHCYYVRLISDAPERTTAEEAIANDY